MTTPTDDYPSNDPTVALLPGATRTGAFETTGDVDALRVHLEAGHNYRFTSPALTALSLALPEEIYPGIYASGAGDSTTLSYRPEVSGDYVLRVAAAWNGPLVWRASFAEIPLDDYGTAGTARGTLAPGQALAGALEANNDHDVFLTTVERGVSYRLTLEYTDGTSASTSYIGLQHDGITGATLNPTFQRSGSTLSTVFASVQGGPLQLDLSGAPGAYRLHLDALPGDLPANPATTGALAVNGSALGTADSYEDVDWFRTHLDAGQSYLFTATAVDAGRYAPAVGIYSADGAKLDHASGNGAQSTAGFAPQASGDYFVAVNSSDVGKQYTVSAVTIADDNAAGLAALPVLAVGQTRTGKIDFTGDTDGFQIDSATGTYLRLTLTDADRSNPVSAEIRAADGHVLGHASPGGTFTVRADSPGPLSIYIDGGYYNTANHAYSLTLESAVSDAESDTPDGARLVAVNEMVRGSIDGYRDYDYFHMTLDAGQAYDLSAVAGDYGVIAIYAAAPGGNGTSALSHATSRFTATAGGDYIVAVTYPGRDENNYRYDYSFSVAPVAEAVTANASTQGRLAMNGTVTAQLDYASDINWYGVTLQAGHHYRFELGYGQSVAAQVALYNAAGDAVASVDSIEYRTGDRLDFIAGTSGTYYLSLGRSEGHPVTITATDRPLDDVADDRAHALELATSGTATGTLTTGDIDVLHAHLKAGTLYTLAVDQQLRDGSWRALDRVHVESVPFSQFGLDFERGVASVAGEDADIYLVMDAAALKDVTGYSVVLREVGADTLPNWYKQGEPIGIGALVSQLDTPRDHDVVTLAVERDKVYSVSLHSFAGLGGTDLTVSLTRDPESDFARELASFSAAPQGDGTLTFAALADGTVSIDIGHKEFASGTPGTDAYLLRVTRVDGDHTVPVARSATLAAHASQSVLPNQYLDVAFSEQLVRNLGTVRILDAAGKAVASFDTARDPRVHVDGAHAGIDLHGLLYPGGQYSVEFLAGSLTDQSGNKLTATTLRFAAPPAAAAGTGNDVLAGTASAATLDGGAGIDTAVYRGSADDFLVTHSTGTWQVVGRDGTDKLEHIERVLFTSGEAHALDVDGTSGQLYRLYQAAFDRTPDADGVGYWMGVMDRGASLRTVAQTFLDSPEFAQAYGSHLDNRHFLDQLYHNILNRAGDPDGFNWWLQKLDAGAARADVLAAFSESPENQGLTATLIADGFAYTPYWG